MTQPITRNMMTQPITRNMNDPAYCARRIQYAGVLINKRVLCMQGLWKRGHGNLQSPPILNLGVRGGVPIVQWLEWIGFSIHHPTVYSNLSFENHCRNPDFCPGPVAWDMNLKGTAARDFYLCFWWISSTCALNLRLWRFQFFSCWERYSKQYMHLQNWRLRRFKISILG